MSLERRLSERDVRERIAAGEGQRVDFKRELGHPNELAGDLVCFANAEGGEILIGIDSTGTIVGVQDIEAVQRRVQEVEKNNVLSPLRGIETQSVATTDGDVVVVYVPRSSERPHVTVDGVCKVRKGNTCQRVTPADLRSIVQSTGAVAPLSDERVVPGTSLADMDLDRVGAVLQRDAAPSLTDPADYLRARRLVLAEGATIAAILCYGRAPQSWLPHALVVAVRHRGTITSAELADRQELGGRLDEQFAATAGFVKTHLPSPRDLSGLGDEDRGLPAEALRHALINALAHRDYDIPSPVRVHVFDDRVEILSPGRLLNSLTLETLRSGAISLPRNPRTYWELVRMGLATWTGLGLRRMREAMAERSLPEPDIQLVGPEVHVTLRLVPAAASA